MTLAWRRRAAGAALLAALASAGPVAAAAAEPRAVVFDGAAALRHVERLVAIGPRPAGSPASGQARKYIAEELRRVGARVEVQSFDAETPHGRLAMANVVGVLPGRRAEAILIGGHYDTKWFRDVRFVGANDGGSSGGFLLELARRLAAGPREYTYWIVFFDGEEARETWTARDSLYGSRRMAGELQRTNRLPRAVIVVDMIGDRHLNIRPEALSTAWLTEAIWASARRLGYQAHFLPDPQVVEDDHAPFLRAGVPATLLIDFDYPPWHTADDTLDQVSARSLQIVGEVLLQALPAIEERLGASGGGTRR
ncbi:MAG: M28 family peptidase [Candidatus Rokubacteria bacterium]|nr:M28 family peptidase [Candidatus Rokubacteria bacterium]